MCILFPYSFEGHTSTWYFTLEAASINSWQQFEALFLQKFEDDNTAEDLVIELSSLKISPKEGVKDFNQRFSCLKNKIPVRVLPTEELLVAYFIKGLPRMIDM